MKLGTLVISAILSVGIIALPNRARADLWGGDDIILGEILSNAISQLAQLEQILGTGKDNLDLLREINQGINDSLRILRTVSPYTDPGIYRDWRTVERAIHELESIYGPIARSSEEGVQRNTDQSVAEAITLNNEIYDYTQKLDTIGDEIVHYSHDVSPGGAQKLTAEALGVLLNLTNQSLRTQATGLKLQAQAIALENRREKERTRFFTNLSDDLGSALTRRPVRFETPRF